MPIEHQLWRVSRDPLPLPSARLPSEDILEQMIVASPRILSNDWMLIGRQHRTTGGKRPDLLALAPDGNLIVIELKRDRSPRDVVAQALEYAHWAQSLDSTALAKMYKDFSQGGDLDQAFENRFNRALSEVALNGNHEIVIVAAELDSSTERIVDYLAQRNVAINVLFFQVFETSDGQLLSRAWLRPPAETQVAAATNSTRGPKEPWNGEWYASFGHDEGRDWDEARHYGFISAGGGSWYTGTLSLPSVGDLMWVKAPQCGFVGVGRVGGPPTTLEDLRLLDSDRVERPAMEILKAHYYRDCPDGSDEKEVFLPITWAQTRALSNAVQETGMFGNQNTVCAPKTPAWRHTVERLKELFPNWNKPL